MVKLFALAFCSRTNVPITGGPTQLIKKNYEEDEEIEREETECSYVRRKLMWIGTLGGNSTIGESLSSRIWKFSCAIEVPIAAASLESGRCGW